MKPKSALSGRGSQTVQKDTAALSRYLYTFEAVFDGILNYFSFQTVGVRIYRIRS